MFLRFLYIRGNIKKKKLRKIENGAKDFVYDFRSRFEIAQKIAKMEKKNQRNQTTRKYFMDI